MAQQRLEAVAQALNFHLEREPEPGFLTGLAGQAVFFYSFGRSWGSSRYENLGFLALERALGMINAGFSWPSFAAGLSGIRYALHFLASRGFITEADGAALDATGPFLGQFAADRLAGGDYDYLHGALGMYLPDALPTGAEGGRLVQRLTELSVEPAPGQRAWLSRHPQTGVPEINLGLAHGVPSVLVALSRLEGTAPLLEAGVRYLLGCRQEASANGSLFPHRMIDGQPDQPGRLAWCYGDAGVGTALWQVGLYAGRPDWRADAIGILHNAAARRDAAANRVADACLCHGTAGLALMFYKMALTTGHEELLDAAAHWARATLDHGTGDGEGAGYRFLTTGDRLVPRYSLIEGITGVGLALLGMLDAETLGWEMGLLI